MSETAGIDAFGTQLQRGDGGTPEVFTAIANITEPSGPEMERTIIDMTAHDSPDGWMEHTGGLKNPGEVSITVNYDPSKHDSLIADFEDPNARNYRLVWPTITGARWDFKAVMSGFSPEAPVDDKLSAEITFQLSGKPTLVAA